MASDVNIWRSAMKVIQECGQNQNAKEYAFAQASERFDKGDLEEASRWAEIANTIDKLLEDIPRQALIPTALH